MDLENNLITPDKRVATSDARFDMRLTENFDDEDAPSSGWPWVAAILFAGMLIASAYLDQESGNFAGTTSSVAGERYAANTAVPLTGVTDAQRPDAQSSKGY